MPTILVVDDEATFRSLLRRHLESAYEILEADNVTDALELTLRRKPDCIMLDLNLPGLPGLELCTILSGMSATQLIPIIVITGDPAASREEIAMVLPIAGFMRKPLDFEELKDRIAAVLRSKQPERRREVRVHLRMALRVAGVDAAGKKFDTSVLTHDVSRSGFSCYSQLCLVIGSIVEVWAIASKQPSMGRALVVRAEKQDVPEQFYGFQFREKPKHWTLG
jgi:DNA-binding response OmpR family regulator